MAISTPAPESGALCDSDPDRSAALEQVKGQLAAESSYRIRLQKELDLRNCALDATDTHFMIIDVSRSQWQIVYANRAIAEDHGYEPGELPGCAPSILVPLELNREVFNEIGQAVRSGNTIRTEVQARRKDGSVFNVGMYMAPARATILGWVPTSRQSFHSSASRGSCRSNW
jgi:PAS domain S-box-containing protein